ncbi:MAG: Ig-like domain-containing protein [Marinicella sp.]
MLSGTAPNLTYTPNGNFNGSDSFTFTVNDGTVDSSAATVSINVAPANDPPTANSQSVNTTEDTAVGITLTGSDPDGDGLTFAVVTGPSNGVLSGTAPNLTYTPNGNFNGSDSFTFTVNDGTVDSSAATVSINVAPANDPPTANSQSVNTTEDTAVGITLTGSDPDGDGLTFAVATGSSNGVLSGTAPNLTYTPNGNFNGSDSFTFTVNDGTVDSSAATVSINVAPANDPPTADSQSVNTTEDTAVGITLTGSDPDGDGLTFAVATGPSNGVLSGTAPNLTYTPNGNFNGSDSFTFTVNDGTVDSSAATVSINVDAVNDQPSFVAEANVKVAVADIGSIAPQLVACQFDMGPDDEDSSQSVQDFLVTIAADPNGVLTGVDVDNNGQMSYTFSGNQGVATLNIQLQDNGGTDFGGVDTSGVQTLQVHVQDYIFTDSFEGKVCQ